MVFEVQTVTTSFTSDVGRAGYFTLASNDGAVKTVTEPLAWDATAAAVQKALRNLADIEEDTVVTRLETATNFIYNVTFGGYVGDRSPLIADYVDLIGQNGQVTVTELTKGTAAHIMTNKRPIQNYQVG